MRRYGRREALLKGPGFVAAAAGAAGVACAPPAPPNGVTPAELYVGLARDRVVAILDTVTDRVTQRISLAALGRQGHLSQIAVAPSGTAVVLPVTGGSPDVGLLCPPEPASSASRSQRPAPLGGHLRRSEAAASPAAGEALCSRVPVVGARAAELLAPDAHGSGAAGAGNAWGAQGAGGAIGARQLVADARGRAYVVVSDAVGAGPALVAVVDLAGGRVLRYLPLAEAGDRVGALAVTPDGSRLFAAIYAGMWPVASAARRGQASRLIAVDSQDGRVCAAAGLPAGTGAVTGLVVAAPPSASRAATASPATATRPMPTPPAAAAQGAAPGAASQAVYVALSSRPPQYLDDDVSGLAGRTMLLALDAVWLDTLDVWTLDRAPAGLAVLPDGRRAYALLAANLDGPWSRELLSLDLAGGASRRWPIPSGAFALALSSAGKLYIADTLDDRLWRLDTRTDTLLTPLSLPGAPLALGSRPP